jgi:hypothetical protein
VAANILVTFTADSDSLDASVKQATKDIAVIGDKAAEAGKKASDSFKDAGKSAAAAFSSGQVKAAIDSQVKSIDSLKAGIKKLYDEEIKLLSAGQKQSAAYKKNIEDAAKLRAELDKLTKGTTVYGNETVKVDKAAVSLKTQLKNLKAELSDLEIQGKDNTAQFAQTAFAAARLEDQIGDTNERVRVLASDTFKFDAAVGAVQGLAAGFAVAQGAVALFGAESKDLEKVIARTQGAIALLNGVQEVANLLSGQSAVKLAILTAAQNVFNTSVAGGGRALKIFTSALAITGIGALVVAIGLVVNALMKVAESSELAQSALRSLEATNAQLNKKIIESQEQLDLARGKITEKEAQRNQIQRQQKEDLTKQLIANDKALAAAEESISSAQSLKRFAFTEKQNLAADNLLRLANERKAKIIAQGEDNIARINEDYQNQYAITYVKENEKEVKAVKDKTKKVVKEEEIKYATLEQVILLGTNRIANIDKLYAENRLQANKESIAAQKSVIQAELEQTKAALNVELMERKANGENQVALNAEILLRKEKAQLDYADAIKSIDDEILANEEKNQEESQANVDKWVKYRADQKKKQLDADKKANKEQIDLIFEYASAISDVFNSLNALSKQASENRIADITTQSQTELDAINLSFDTERQKQRERSALELRTNRQIAAEKTKQAKQDKALALFNAIIGSAAAVAAAKSIPLKIIMAIAGAAQIAAIAAKPIPKFERGGVIGGQRHSQGGTMVEAERDEFITNRKQSIKHRGALEAMNKSSEAFKAYIDKTYVRPAVMNYMLGKKNESMNLSVNATLNSKSMENTLNSMHRTMKKQAKQSQITDTRYSWHNQ